MCIVVEFSEIIIIMATESDKVAVLDVKIKQLSITCG